MSEPRISVEISSFNRKEILGRCLESLAAQTLSADEFEVVVSDDGSTDGAPEWVEALAPRLPYALRLLRNAHQGPGPTHNDGIRACRAPLVLMLAADILAEPPLVEEHLSSHREHPDETVVVGGRLVQSPELADSVFQQGWDRLVNAVFQSDRDDLVHGGFLVSNLSFKRSFMLRHGLFRSWPPASQEDIELGHRLRRHDMRLVRNPRALGFHHHPVTLEGVARRSYMEGLHWHHIEAEIHEPWTRWRSGRTAGVRDPGLLRRLRVRNLARRLLLNRFTVESVMEPLVRLSERRPALAALVPVLAGKISSYHFLRGVRAHDGGAVGANPG